LLPGGHVARQSLQALVTTGSEVQLGDGLDERVQEEAARQTLERRIRKVPASSEILQRRLEALGSRGVSRVEPEESALALDDRAGSGHTATDQANRGHGGLRCDAGLGGFAGRAAGQEREVARSEAGRDADRVSEPFAVETVDRSEERRVGKEGRSR